MIVTGIIAEFNPFHNGHKYLLEQAEGVKIVAMSGNFVQRGEPAIVDKWTRAQMALENGADLVVELPFLVAVQSADHFAKGAVEIKPKTYQLNPEQTLFLGGLGRFDFIKGEKQGFTAFFDNELKLHRTKLEGATAFYDKHVGGLLTPPNSKEKEEFPPLISHEFTIKDKTDLVISGLGWIRVNGEAKVAVWAPEGVAVVTRKAII